jgi:hypothetical protein
MMLKMGSDTQYSTSGTRRTRAFLRRTTTNVDGLNLFMRQVRQQGSACGCGAYQVDKIDPRILQQVSGSLPVHVSKTNLGKAVRGSKEKESALRPTPCLTFGGLGGASWPGRSSFLRRRVPRCTTQG